MAHSQMFYTLLLNGLLSILLSSLRLIVIPLLGMETLIVYVFAGWVVLLIIANYLLYVTMKKRKML